MSLADITIGDRARRDPMNWIRIQLKSMAKKKRQLTASEKADKALRKREYMTVFIDGKMKRVRRSQPIDGMDPDEFIRRNADPLWLH